MSDVSVSETTLQEEKIQTEQIQNIEHLDKDETITKPEETIESGDGSTCTPGESSDLGNTVEQGLEEGNDIPPVVETPSEPVEPEKSEAELKEIKRQKDLRHATNEALSTEVTYVNQLLLLEREFMKPIKDSLANRSSIMDQNDYTVIFMDLEIIINVNKELLASLKDFFRAKGYLKDGVDVDPKIAQELTLGKIFLKMTPFLKSYKNYCSKYDGNFKIITERRKSSKAFKKFLSGVEFQQVTNFQSLDSLLILPVQRIPRYNMLLGEIIKHTKKDDPDYAELVKALELIQKVAVTVNDHMKELDIRQKIIDISNSIANSIDLISPSRKYVSEGLLFMISNKHGLVLRYVFLFSDMILMTQQKPDVDTFDVRNLLGGDQTKYNFRSAVQFTQVPLSWVNPIEDGHVVKNVFQFVSEKKTWTFFTKTKEEKDTWIANINKQLEFMEKTLSSNTIKEKAKLQLPIKGNVTKYLQINPREQQHSHITFLQTSYKRTQVKELKGLEDTPKKSENRRISGFFGKLFGKEKNKLKTVEEGKPIYYWSDSENEDEEDDSKGPEKDEFTEVYSNYIEFSSYSGLKQVLATAEKNFKETEKEWGEDMEEIIVNPLFGARLYSRASYQLEKIKNPKQEELAEKLYRYQVLVPIKMKNVEWEVTTCVDELVPLPNSEKECKEKKNWDMIRSTKGL